MTATIDNLVDYKMAKKKEPSAEEVLQTMKERSEAINDLLETIGHHHSQAYDTAAEKHLYVAGKDGKKRIKHSLLEDDEEKQAAFVEEMARFYEDKAKEHFGVSKDKKYDAMEREMLIKAYTGATKNELMAQVRRHGKNFKKEQFIKLKEDFEKGIAESLSPYATEHVKESHIPGLIKHMGLEALVDESKVRLPEALGLAVAYLKSGAIPPEAISKEVYYKKPKGRIVPGYKVEEKKAA